MDRIEIKATFAIDDKGVLEGIAWPYGSADRVNDIIVKGAVKAMASELPMLRNHDPDLLIGLWDEITETDEGLKVKGRLNETMLARGTRSQIVTGQIGGLSIGFKDRGSTGQKGRNRVITALDLYEVSVLRHPSHPGARITHAKSLDTAEALAAAIRNATAGLKGN